MQIVLLDHVLHPPGGAVELLVEMLRTTAGNVCDNEAGLDPKSTLEHKKVYGLIAMLHCSSKEDRLGFLSSKLNSIL